MLRLIITPQMLRSQLETEALRNQFANSAHYEYTVDEDAEDLIKIASQLINESGSLSDKQDLVVFTREVREAIAGRDTGHLRYTVAELRDFVLKQPGLWVAHFNHLNTRRQEMTDPSQVDKWFAKGHRAIKQNDLATLKAAVSMLYSHLSPMNSERTEKPQSQRRRKAEIASSDVDSVHFSITSPPTVASGTSFVLYLWAYLEHQRGNMIWQAREAVGGGEVSIQPAGPYPIPRGTVLSIRLEIEEFVVAIPKTQSCGTVR
jgi:hypothetical protein